MKRKENKREKEVTKRCYKEEGEGKEGQQRVGSCNKQRL